MFYCAFFSFAVLLWIFFAISLAIGCQLHRMIFDELFVFEWEGGGLGFSFFHGIIEKFSLAICSQVVHTMFNANERASPIPFHILMYVMNSTCCYPLKRFIDIGNRYKHIILSSLLHQNKRIIVILSTLHALYAN